VRQRIRRDITCVQSSRVNGGNVDEQPAENADPVPLIEQLLCQFIGCERFAQQKPFESMVCGQDGQVILACDIFYEVDIWQNSTTNLPKFCQSSGACRASSDSPGDSVQINSYNLKGANFN